MNQLQKLTNQIRLSLFLILILNDSAIFYGWYLSRHNHQLSAGYIELAVAVIALLFAILVVIPAGSFLIQPVRMLWHAILHIAPDGDGQVEAPPLATIQLGQELVDNLTRHIYQLASVAKNVDEMGQTSQPSTSSNPIAGSLPLPLLALDSDQVIVFANDAAAHYLNQSVDEILHQNVYSVLDFSFTNNQTLDHWLEDAAKNTVTTTRLWERVRLTLPGNDTDKFLDLAAYYNKYNPYGYEILLTLFDHTKTYSADEQSLNFVSLAVHELRTPLTLMRGYIEALQEDLTGKLPAEDADFLQRMELAGQQLAKLINNVLSVAHVEDGQFVVKLQSEDWPQIINSAATDMTLRARLQNVTIKTIIAPNLPAVAADRTSLYEVLSNLLDNAIKYSPNGGTVTIKARATKDGEVETTIQDQGIGIPLSLVPNLFERFYRSHRSRGQINGTGLGLYLSKAIVVAHGGHIWVRSREGRGTSFGFTLLPHDKLPATPNGNSQTHSAEAWIKNHSLYRR